MKIFVPFTKLRAETALAVPDANFVALLGENGYGEYLRQRWEAGETFINVEHDVVPSREMLESLWACPEPLCVTGYQNNPMQPEISYLGCVKISAEFIAAHPGAFDHAPHWHHCDTVIWTCSGNTNHYHGFVQHLH